MTALAEKIGLRRACQVLNVPRSRVYRASQLKTEARPHPSPRHTLSPKVRAEIRETLNSEAYMDKAPRQVYAALLDEKRYLCYWRTMYRILAEHHEVRERRVLRRHPVYQKPELLATGAN